MYSSFTDTTRNILTSALQAATFHKTRQVVAGVVHVAITDMSQVQT
jgi:hypothetical protein